MKFELLCKKITFSGEKKAGVSELNFPSLFFIKGQYFHLKRFDNQKKTWTCHFNTSILEIFWTTGQVSMMV